MADGNPDSLIPLTGALDLRSGIDTQVKGAVRWRENFRTISKTQAQRRPQWRRLLASTEYNNQDLHDQLLSLQRKFNLRQPPTCLFAGVTTSNQPVLVAATESTIYGMTESNWRVLGDSFGRGLIDGSGPRFDVSMNGDYIVFTNGFDAPVYYPVGEPENDDGQSVSTFDELDLIGLTQARVTFEWRGITFFADVTMDGQRCSYRLVWSDFNNPLGYDPSVFGTLSGTQDLNFIETILAGAPYGNGFLIYTTHGIWSMTPNPNGGQPGQRTFSFVRLYGFDSNAQARVGCLKYRHSLVQAGEQHLYIGEDNIYAFNPFYVKPQIADWINQASVKLIDEVNAGACDNVVGAMNGREAWFSYPSGQSILPDETLVLNTQYSAADYLGFGFTAFAEFYTDNSQSVRQFILQNGICTEEGLKDGGYPYGGEGISTFPIPAPAFLPTCIYTNTPLTVLDTTVEDYTKETADVDSLCALLGTTDATAVCNRPCDGPGLFIGVSAADWCIKEIGGVWYRETCQNPTAIGVTSDLGYATAAGSYSLDGFDTVLRIVEMHGKTPNQDVHASKFELEFDPDISQPTAAVLRIGQSSQAADPNNPAAAIKWTTFSSKAIGRLSPTPLTPGVRLANTCQWNYVMGGHYLFYDFRISGTGGDVIFTRATVTGDVRDVRNR